MIFVYIRHHCPLLSSLAHNKYTSSWSSFTAAYTHTAHRWLCGVSHWQVIWKTLTPFHTQTHIVTGTTRRRRRPGLLRPRSFNPYNLPCSWLPQNKMAVRHPCVHKRPHLHPHTITHLHACVHVSLVKEHEKHSQSTHLGCYLYTSGKRWYIFVHHADVASCEWYACGLQTSNTRESTGVAFTVSYIYIYIYTRSGHQLRIWHVWCFAFVYVP